MNGATTNGSAHRTASEMRNGYSNGSQQQLRRTHEAEAHERSRSRGGEYRNGVGYGPPPAGAVTERHHFYDPATGAHGFSENSSWETREHFERKVQKGAKKGQLAEAGSGSRARLDQWSSSGLAIERVR